LYPATPHQPIDYRTPARAAKPARARRRPV